MQVQWYDRYTVIIVYKQKVEDNISSISNYTKYLVLVMLRKFLLSILIIIRLTKNVRI